MDAAFSEHLHQQGHSLTQLSDLVASMTVEVYGRPERAERLCAVKAEADEARRRAVVALHERAGDLPREALFAIVTELGKVSRHLVSGGRLLAATDRALPDAHDLALLVDGALHDTLLLTGRLPPEAPRRELARKGAELAGMEESARLMLRAGARPPVDHRDLPAWIAARSLELQLVAALRQCVTTAGLVLNLAAELSLRGAHD